MHHRPRCSSAAAGPGHAYPEGMCRSIKTLRPPFTDHATDDDMRAAALQYVRKVAGMRAPGKVNAEAFDQAVDAIAEATHELLHRLQVRPSTRRTAQTVADSTSA
jgi:hypothetical protein